jgi:hypothetical protein
VVDPEPPGTLGREEHHELTLILTTAIVGVVSALPSVSGAAPPPAATPDSTRRLDYELGGV